jgi:hypothetical protein
MELRDKIDKTKKNINISSLNEIEKKELFNKFIDAGGEVIKETRRKGLTDFDREKQKKYRSRIDGSQDVPADKNDEAARAAGKKENEYQSASSAYREKKGISRWLVRFLDRWVIRFHLFFQGTTDLYGEYISKNFLEDFDRNYKMAMLELQLVHFDIFKQSSRVGNSIAEELDVSNPLYLELIEMTANIFDRTLINQIIEHHQNFPHIAQPSQEISAPLMQLLKKLYVLHPYKDFLEYAFERAIQLQMVSEKGKASNYTLKRKKVKNDLIIVFERLYRILFWLFCLYNEERFHISDPRIGRILGVTSADMPGRREKKKANQQKSDETEVPAEETGENHDLPEEVRKGLSLMYRLDLNELQTAYDTDGMLKNIKHNDKILITNILFREFDNEYSFIFTTNKIKYNVLFTSDGKVDYRVKLSDIYNDLRKCMNVFKDYIDIVLHYEKIREEKPTSNAQYIEYTNKLNTLEKKRSSIGKNVRMSIKAFMEKVAAELHTLIADMNGAQRIIENPQEVFEFDLPIEGSKKMNGKKVYEAILDAYYYVSAFVYRLSTDGDLHGSLEFSEEDMQNMPKEDAALKVEENNNKDDKEPDSVIKELEDLF